MGKRKAKAARGGQGPVRFSKRLKGREKDGQPVMVWEGRSPFQEPEHPILETILEQLLAQPGGKKWVRMASLVCSYWRGVAMDVLLADTAVSKPERPPMPGAPSDSNRCNTVLTQAAVMWEASNSTGFEALSKQHPDNPAPPAYMPHGGHRPRGGGASYPAGRRAQQAQQQQPRHRALRAVRAPGAAAGGPAAAAAPAVAAAAAGPQQEGPDVQQGSIESGMAVRRQAPMSDSESDGSTGARQPPGEGRGRRGRTAGRQQRGRARQQQQQLPPRQQQQHHHHQQQQPVMGDFDNAFAFDHLLMRVAEQVGLEHEEDDGDDAVAALLAGRAQLPQPAAVPWHVAAAGLAGRHTAGAAAAAAAPEPEAQVARRRRRRRQQRQPVTEPAQHAQQHEQQQAPEEQARQEGTLSRRQRRRARAEANGGAGRSPTPAGPSTRGPAAGSPGPSSRGAGGRAGSRGAAVAPIAAASNLAQEAAPRQQLQQQQQAEPALAGGPGALRAVEGPGGQHEAAAVGGPESGPMEGDAAGQQQGGMSRLNRYLAGTLSSLLPSFARPRWTGSGGGGGPRSEGPA